MICRICGCDVTGEGGLSCCSCSAPFHRDCWEFNGGCGIYGCGGREEKAFEEGAPRGGVLQIEDGTAPPFRLAPHVERLVRCLPGWGRAVVPPVVVGLLDGLLLFGAVGLAAGRFYTMSEGWPLLVVALGGAVTVSVLAGAIRRWPVQLLASSLALCGGLIHGLDTVLVHVRWDLAAFVLLMCALVAATCVAELAVGRREAVRRLGGWRRALVEGLAATGAMVVVCLAVVAGVGVAMEGLRVQVLELFLESRLYIVVGLLSLLGFGATAPAAALAASPLMHRLKAEARREEGGA